MKHLQNVFFKGDEQDGQYENALKSWRFSHLFVGSKKSTYHE